ncbi:MAG: MamI family restriction endonuclease [Planctomycetes bacterium]|nr:MamI family restriction endonuclease [Planctomycetota bacterium]
MKIQMSALKKALAFLNNHREAFFKARQYAEETGHTVPSDTKSSSQILVSILTGTSGLHRKKGRDLEDGSDVKAANAWDAIDVPRFNGVLPAGRKKMYGDVSALDDMPFVYFVLWDRATGLAGSERCRVWVVRPKVDATFRAVADRWYKARERGEITSDNFQLHPPIGDESNLVTNEAGNLLLPLFFRADFDGRKYRLKIVAPEARTSAECRPE